MFRTLRVVVFRDNQRFAEAGQGVIDGLNSKNDVTSLPLSLILKKIEFILAMKKLLKSFT